MTLVNCVVFCGEEDLSVHAGCVVSNKLIEDVGREDSRW